MLFLFQRAAYRVKANPAQCHGELYAFSHVHARQQCRSQQPNTVSWQLSRMERSPARHQQEEGCAFINARQEEKKTLFICNPQTCTETLSERVRHTKREEDKEREREHVRSREP